MNPPQPARKASSIKRSYSASTICGKRGRTAINRSEEHTSELQSQSNLVCRLLLEKKKNKHRQIPSVVAPLLHIRVGSIHIRHTHVSLSSVAVRFRPAWATGSYA